MHEIFSIVTLILNVLSVIWAMQSLENTVA